MLRGREIGDADAQRIHGVLQSAFDPWPITAVSGVPAIEHLRWRLDGPQAPGSLVVLAEDGPRLVAARIDIPWPVRLLGARATAMMGTDKAVLPDYRGRGIDARSTTTADEQAAHEAELSLSIGLWRVQGRPSARGLAASPPFANRVRRLVAVLDARRAAERRLARSRRLPAPLARIAAPSLAAALALAASRAAGGSRAPGVSIEEMKRPDERLAEFFDAATRPFDLVSAHTVESFGWRFFDPRAGSGIRTLAAEEGSGLVGYAAVKVSAGHGEIVALLALPGRLDAVDALLGHAVGLCRGEGAISVSCWLSARHPYRGLLRRRGFFASRQETGVAHRLLRRQDELAFLTTDSRARIHLTHSDFTGA